MAFVIFKKSFQEHPLHHYPLQEGNKDKELPPSPYAQFCFGISVPTDTLVRVNEQKGAEVAHRLSVTQLLF